MVDRKRPDRPAERVTRLERLIVSMQRREPLTEDEKVTLDEVMERHQDDPLRKFGEIELGALYWAQAGTHIGGTRRSTGAGHRAHGWRPTGSVVDLFVGRW
jgi:hypothetical protein